jgi:hypothetical protein
VEAGNMATSQIITTNVVPIPEYRRTPNEIHVSLDHFDGILAVKMLSQEIGREMAINPKLKLKDIARKANLSPTTVGKIYNRDTHYPRHYTIISLFKALGFSAVKVLRE